MGGSATERFAQAVHKELIGATGRKNRGIKRSGDLYVLKSTNMHAILVECGFMTNMEEAELMCEETYRKKCAEVICKGVCGFYGKEYKGGTVMAEMTVQEAVAIIKDKTGLEDKSMEFMLNYKWGDSLVKKLAGAMLK